MKFTDQKPMIATEKDCQGRWKGGNNGKYFRCHFCGHKFKPGDQYRWIYTNDLSGYGGNPFVCQQCDDTTENVIAKWKLLVDQWHADSTTKYWSFIAQERNRVYQDDDR